MSVSSKTYPNWMNNLLCYFDLWGLPTDFRMDSNYQKISRLSTILISILGLIVTVLLIIYLKRPTYDPLGTLNDVIKYAGILIVFWSSLFELNTKHSIRRRFWCTFEQIDALYCSHRRFEIANYLNKFRFCSSTFAIVCLIYLHRITSDTGSQYLYFWFTNFTLIAMYLNRVFYFLFYLELIKYELSIIEKETKELVRAYRNTECAIARGKTMLEFQQKRFKWIRDYFQAIYFMCDSLNQFLGWSNAITILFSFQLIITDVIWVYWKYYNQQEVHVLC